MHTTTKLGLLSLAVIAVLLSGCTIAVTTSQDWGLYYKWDNSAQGFAVWTLYSNFTFSDDKGGTGYWSLNNTFFQLQYNTTFYSYAKTTYTGTYDASTASMSGTMTGTDSNNVNHSGTWYAELGWGTVKGIGPSTGEGAAPSAQPTRTPSGEPIQGD